MRGLRRRLWHGLKPSAILSPSKGKRMAGVRLVLIVVWMQILCAFEAAARERVDAGLPALSHAPARSRNRVGKHTTLEGAVFPSQNSAPSTQRSALPQSFNLGSPRSCPVCTSHVPRHLACLACASHALFNRDVRFVFVMILKKAPASLLSGKCRLRRGRTAPPPSDRPGSQVVRQIC